MITADDTKLVLVTLTQCDDPISIGDLARRMAWAWAETRNVLDHLHDQGRVTLHSGRPSSPSGRWSLSVDQLAAVLDDERFGVVQ